MKFEVDLIRYVIDIAIIRGTYFRSKDLNADWLPFLNIIEVFEDICEKLGVSKEIEDRCYKALLKMSSSDEKHLTWSYKVQNIDKYLPSKSSTHSAKHTTNSWTKHKDRYGSTPKSASQSTNNFKTSPKSSTRSGFGINLGRITQRPIVDDNCNNLNRYYPSSGSPVVVQHAEFGSHGEEQTGEPHSPRVNVDVPVMTPKPPPQPSDITFSSPPPPATPYYQNFVPSPRLSAIARNTPPSGGAHAPTAAVPRSTQAGKTSPQNRSVTHAPLSPPDNSTIRFGEDAIRAMHDRVVSIELEAKKTRQLLAHIAYVKSHGRSDSLQATSGESIYGDRTEGHTRHIDYGELELSPYLKHVLDLPPAVITTDVFETLALKNNDDKAGVYRSRSSSHKSNLASPKAMRFSMDTRDNGHGVGSAQRSNERPRSPQPSTMYQRSPSPSSQVMRSEQRDHDLRYDTSTSEENWKVQLSPEAHYKSYANSLRNSPAMQKYAAYSSVPHRSSPAQQPMQRGSVEHQAYLNSLAARSPRSRSSSEAERFAAANMSPVSPVVSTGNFTHSTRPGLAVNTTTPTRLATASGSGGGSGAYGLDYDTPGTPGTPTSSAPPTPHSVHGASPSPSPSPSQRYRNSCHAQRTEQAGVTVIDSKIDDLLGDSLNIEEKDGRVYVHFQSKFVLPGL